MSFATSVPAAEVAFRAKAQSGEQRISFDGAVHTWCVSSKLPEEGYREGIIYDGQQIEYGYFKQEKIANIARPV